MTSRAITSLPPIHLQKTVKIPKNYMPTVDYRTDHRIKLGWLELLSISHAHKHANLPNDKRKGQIDNI